MHKSKMLILPALISVITSLTVSHAVDARVSDADKRKSDYVYMEALRQNTLGNRDAYVKLLNRASELNPEETAYLTDLGFYEIALYGSTDTTMLRSGLTKMRRHFDSKPDDYYSSLTYGTLMGKLGNIDESVRVYTILDSIYPDKNDVALNLAEVLAQTGDTTNLRKSIDIFSRMERVLGPSLILTGSKVRSYLALNDTVGATSEIGSFLKESPNDVAALITAGDINMALQRTDSALVYYNRACEADSTYGPAFYKRAAYYQAIGDSARYDSEILEVLSKDNLEYEMKMELLRVYLTDVYSDSLKQPQIDNLFNHMIDRHPHEVDLHKLYASYLVAINDFTRAAEQQNYALDIDPANEKDWLGLMMLYAQSGDFNRQAAAGRDALRYFPESADINLYESLALTSSGDARAAMSYIDRAIDLITRNDSTDNEKLSSIYCTKGDIFYSLHIPDSAFIFYEKSIETDPNNLLALNNCAYYLACENRDLDRAEAMSARTVAEEPDNTSSLDTYAWIMFMKRDYKTAKEYIDKTLELDKDPSSDLFHHAGDIYFMAGDPNGAVTFWKKALELEPDNKLLKRKIKNKAYFYE